MSYYTTELRFICETYAGLEESADSTGVNAVISAAIPKIFDFDFPIFDEAYRNVLCTKILKHYYTREICCETVGRWKLFLDTRLNEIMPMYNRMYVALQEKANLVHDIDITTEHTGKRDEESKTQSNRNGFSTTSDRTEHDINTDNTTNGQNINKYSETPQNGIDDVITGKYLTNATVNTSENVNHTGVDEVSINNGSTQNNDNFSSTDNIGTTDSYITHMYGKSHGGSYAKAIKELADNLVDTDMCIIKELEDLFMALW